MSDSIADLGGLELIDLSVAGVTRASRRLR